MVPRSLHCATRRASLSNRKTGARSKKPGCFGRDDSFVLVRSKINERVKGKHGSLLLRVEVEDG